MSNLTILADFVRQQDHPVTINQILAGTGLTRAQVHSCMSKAIREFEDIRPAGPGTIECHPGWKTDFPREWEAVQGRNRKRTRLDIPLEHWEKRPTVSYRTQGQAMPNVVGPVISVYNVVAINIYSDRVSVQHADGSWTSLDGHLTLTREGGELCRESLTSGPWR